MNLQSILLIGIIFIVTLVVSITNKSKIKSYRIIIFILILISSSVSIPFQVKFLNINGVSIYIRIVVYALVLIFILTVNKRTFKFKLDESMMILILINCTFQFINNRIYILSSAVELLVLYASILFIGITCKNLKGLNDIKILKFFNYIAIMNCILGLLQFITGKMLIPGSFDKSILYGSGYEAVRRVGGLAGTNNAAGNLGAILFAIVFFNYLREKNKLSLIALICTCIFSALTLTRIGYLAIVVELLIFFLVSKWQTKKQVTNKISIFIISSFIILFNIILFGGKVYEILFLKRGDTSKWRTIQFTRIFEWIIPDNSIWDGIGIGQYKFVAANIYNYSDIDVHSQYINIWVENGFIMFLAFLIMNLCIFYKALKNTKGIQEKAFILSLFTGNLICSNYNPNQYYLINNYFYYILIYLFIYRRKE